MKASRAIWLFILILTALRWSTLGSRELEFDEAHYWLWSDRLAPAYFTKGPGIALAIHTSAVIFGANEFGIRFFSPLLAAGTSLLLFYFTRRFYQETAALWLVVALNATPIFALGSFLMTIDPLSIFFWVAAMFTFWLALEKTPRFSLWWPLTGLLIGFGFLCKYTNALQLVSVLLVLALVPRLRAEFKRPGLYLLLGIFLLSLIPPLIWNAQHAWVTISHLGTKGGLTTGPGIHPTELLKFIGQHFLIYSPLLFLGLVLGVWKSLPRLKQSLKTLFLFWFGAPVFILYLLLSVNKAAAPNWDALALLSLGVLAVGAFRESLDGLWARRVMLAAVVIGFAMSAFALDSDLLHTFGFKLARRDPSNRLRGWQSATAAVEQLRHQYESQLGQPLFLIADDRDRASEVSFYLKDKRVEGPWHPPVYLVESQDLLNQFSFWPRYDEFVTNAQGTAGLANDGSKPANPDDAPYSEGGVNLFSGRSALFIRDGANGSLVHNVRAAFNSAYPIAILQVTRYGQTVRTWRIFLCQQYRTLPL